MWRWPGARDITSVDAHAAHLAPPPLHGAARTLGSPPLCSAETETRHGAESGGGGGQRV